MQVTDIMSQFDMSLLESNMSLPEYNLIILAIMKMLIDYSLPDIVSCYNVPFLSLHTSLVPF